LRRSLLALVLLAPHTAAQTSYPMITHVAPVAVQRGKTTEVTVTGQMNFFGVYKALFEGHGISAEGLPPAPAAGVARNAVKSVKFRVKVEANAAPGVRDFRLASTLGPSSIGQIVIVDAPVVQESGRNNTIETANPIPVPCVVAGTIEAAEDVDFFKFHA